MSSIKKPVTTFRVVTKGTIGYANAPTLKAACDKVMDRDVTMKRGWKVEYEPHTVPSAGQIPGGMVKGDKFIVLRIRNSKGRLVQSITVAPRH